MAYVIRLLARADGTPVHGAGYYVVAYDPAAHGGRGAIDVGLLEYARRFDTPQEAVAFSLLSAGRRADGELNRPLLAFHVEVVEALEAAIQDGRRERRRAPG